MELISKSAKETLNLGKRLARHLKPPDIICLFGQLGSGKTVLAKGIAQGLGIKQTRVISPSFVLIRQYRSPRLSLYHFDLYRLNSEDDIFALGYEEYFYNEAITVVEWADRLSYLLPKEYLKVELLFKSAAQRLIKFKALGSHYKDLLDRLDEDIRH